MVGRDRDMSIKSRTMLDRWAKFAQFLLWPGTCVLCRQPSHVQRDLCAACVATLIEVASPCPGCGLPLPPGCDGATLRCGACVGAHPLAQVVAPYAWEEPVSGLISGYKYTGQLQ